MTDITGILLDVRLIHPSNRGFTLIELLAVVAIIGILGSVAVSYISDALRDARYSQAIKDLKSYNLRVTKYMVDHGEPPHEWDQLGMEPPRDPWGNKYVLNNHDHINPGKRRKDGPTVPINSHYDLFSPGPNQDWDPVIQAQSSVDDVIVAADGSFIGKAEDY